MTLLYGGYNDTVTPGEDLIPILAELEREKNGQPPHWSRSFGIREIAIIADTDCFVTFNEGTQMQCFANEALTFDKGSIWKMSFDSAVGIDLVYGF